MKPLALILLLCACASSAPLDPAPEPPPVYRIGAHRFSVSEDFLTGLTAALESCLEREEARESPSRVVFKPPSAP